MKHLYRFYRDNKEHWGGLLLVSLLGFLAGVFKYVASFFWGQSIDYGLSGKGHLALKAALFVTIVVLADCVRTAIHYRLIGYVTEGMFFSVRTKAFNTLLQGETGFLEKYFRSGDTVTRLNSDIDDLSSFIAGDVSHFSRLFFQGVLAFAGCALLSWQLTVVNILVVLSTLWCVKRVSKPIQRHTENMMRDRGNAINIVSEVISNFVVVKAYEIGDNLIKLFSDKVNATYKRAKEVEKVSVLLTGIKYISSAIQTMTLYLLGAVLVSDGFISVGDALAFFALNKYIVEFLEQIDYMLKTTRRAEATAVRFYDMLNIPCEEDGIAQSMTSATPCSFETVSFAYHDRPVINSIELTVGEHQQIAIVGESGSGKSTLLKLVCRFYLPNHGAVKLFGIDTTLWQGEQLRKNLSIVTQESFLFDGSIYENLALGDEKVSKEECLEALMSVGLRDFICAHPEGLNYEIGEFGNRLSGGERQRLCIARAMVRNAPLMLFDEPTSALDAKTEVDVQNVLKRLLIERSAIFITHRLSIVKNMDYIYYMEHGQIVEHGTPKELFERRGKFFSLYMLQNETEVTNEEAAK